MPSSSSSSSSSSRDAVEEPSAAARRAVAGCMPPAVCCHTLVDANDGRLMAFGGAVISQEFGDVYSYLLETNTWRKESTTNADIAPPRMSHSAVMIGDEMIVYGGLHTKPHLQVIDNVVALNVKTMAWRLIPATGNPEHHPGPRRSHSAVAYNGKMYVYMGYPSRSPKELSEFDPKTGAWKAIIDNSSFGKPFSSMHGHSAAVEGSNMYIFGGQSNHSDNTVKSFSNKLYTFSFITQKWREIIVSHSHPTPAPRYAQAMTVCDGVVAIHGGDSLQCTIYYEDTWFIDTAACSPKAVLPGESAHEEGGGEARTELPRWFDGTVEAGLYRPTRRSGHATVFAQGSFYVFGGECPSSEPETVLYSAELYRLPLKYSLQASLQQLASRWLATILPSQTELVDLQELFDRDEPLLQRLPPRVTTMLNRHLARGKIERPMVKHRLH